MRAKKPEKILIRGPNWVGDAVLAIPAMKAVRALFPDAEITLFVRPFVAGLYAAAPFIDKVWSEANHRVWPIGFALPATSETVDSIWRFCCRILSNPPS